MLKGTNFSPKPIKVEVGKSLFIVDVACGDGHSVILFNDRDVWLWGCNTKGQLGQNF